MSHRFFLDTNVLVYTFDSRDPAKRERAISLVEGALTGDDGLISFQVVQEFLNVATRKFTQPLSPDRATLYLNRVLSPLCAVFASVDLYRAALALAGRRKYSFFDSLILVGALESGCGILYSEDFQHGQEIEGLTIVNPFREGS